MGQDKTRVYAKRINQVIDYVYTHLNEELSVTRLSRVAGFSPYHFHRQFSQYTGIGVYRLVQLIRLKRASLQLVFNPRASVMDIALDAGFSNPEAFSRAFKKVSGQTPSGFRRSPRWHAWQTRRIFNTTEENANMQVEIVNFPRTTVAALEHHV